MRIHLPPFNLRKLRACQFHPAWNELKPKPPFFAGEVFQSHRKLPYFLEEVEFWLSYDAGEFHPLTQIIRFGKSMRFAKIFPLKKDHHFVWIFFAAKKATSFAPRRFPFFPVLIELGLPFGVILDFVSNEKQCPDKSSSLFSKVNLEGIKLILSESSFLLFTSFSLYMGKNNGPNLLKFPRRQLDHLLRYPPLSAPFSRRV
jgi:hypothetical protein